MFAGCEDDYKTDITIPMSGIYLSSPAEGATMDLNDESKDSYEFTWDKASEQGSVLIFSTTKDLVTQVTIEAGTGKNDPDSYRECSDRKGRARSRTSEAGSCRTTAAIRRGGQQESRCGALQGRAGGGGHACKTSA